MRFVYNNKVYDAAKSERVIEYMTGKINVVLYRHSDGNWFYVCTERGYQDIRPLGAKYVRNILSNRDRQDLIDKYFADDTESE